MDTLIFQEEAETIGENFIASLALRDFNRIESIFEPQARFRALVPARLCEGKTASEATDWLRRWFGDADEILVLQSAANRVFDRLYLNYRLRVHDVLNGWRVIEQQAYGSVQDGQVTDLWLVCSGFRPDPGAAQLRDASGGPVDAYYHAGGSPGDINGPGSLTFVILDKGPVMEIRFIRADPGAVANGVARQQ
jgi:hypothetical protein